MSANILSTNVLNALLAQSLTSLPRSPFDIVKSELSRTLTRWGNGYLLSVKASGSYAKGTAVSGGTDVDLFCSISSRAPDTLQSIQDTLFNALQQDGYNPRRQNVSIGLNVRGYKVDVTPGKKRGNGGNDHSLYSRKSGSWIQTNVDRHIGFVKLSGRTTEIRWLKCWRHDAQVEWPSFHLEMFCIRALQGARLGNLTANVISVLSALQTDLDRALLDPANTNNNVANSMTYTEKLALRRAAENKIRLIRFYGL
jgi:hypothetical protein